MRKHTTALLMILLTCRLAFPQTIKFFSLPSGENITATSSLLLHNGYLVAGRTTTDPEAPVNYLGRYHHDGSLNWVKTEQSGEIAGIMSMAENSQGELYLLGEDLYSDSHYGLIKTDSSGNALWSVKLDKNSMSTYDVPAIRTNHLDEVYVMSSTFEKTILYKLAGDGSLLWSKTIEIDTVMTKNPAFGIEVTPDGGLICSGKAASDLFMQRFAADGSLLWTKRLFDNDMSYSHPRAITRLQDGNYLVAGFRGENTPPYTTGFFLLKTDINGTVLDYTFCHDTLSQYAFIPYALHEMSDGSIKVMGCGGMLSFADFDASLALQRYSVWPGVENMMVTGNCFQYHDDQWLITGSDETGSKQFILRNAAGLDDFCNQQDVFSVVQDELPVDNDLYNTTANIGKGPVTIPAVYSLTTQSPFAAGSVCGSSEVILGSPETETFPVFSVYPNPVGQNAPLNIRYEGKGEVSAMLVNPAGQVVSQLVLQRDFTEMSTASLAPGMYYLYMSVNEKNVSTTKIIVY